MKARIIATGDIVDVRPYGSNSSSVLWKDIYRNITYADCELDFEVTDKDEIYNKGWADGWDEAIKSEIPKIHPKLKGSDPDYWERLKHQYAGMAMQGMLSNPNIVYKDISTETICNHVAERVKEIAHALVEKMKEKKEQYGKDRRKKTPNVG